MSDKDKCAWTYDEDSYSEWWKDFGMDDATPEEFEAVGNYLKTGVYVEPSCEELPAPVCNHTEGLGKENAGYIAGTLEDGTPFAAEIWIAGESLSMAVILPEKREFIPEHEYLAVHEERKMVERGEVKESDAENHSVLCIGMAIRQEELTFEETVKYVDYLEEMELFEFTSEYRNGHAWALTDVEGNDVVCCDITLVEDGSEWARPLIDFLPFDFEPVDFGADDDRFKVIVGGKFEEDASGEKSGESDDDCSDASDYSDDDCSDASDYEDNDYESDDDDSLYYDDYWVHDHPDQPKLVMNIDGAHIEMCIWQNPNDAEDTHMALTVLRSDVACTLGGLDIAPYTGVDGVLFELIGCAPYSFLLEKAQKLVSGALIERCDCELDYEDTVEFNFLPAGTKSRTQCEYRSFVVGPQDYLDRDRIEIACIKDFDFDERVNGYVLIEVCDDDLHSLINYLRLLSGDLSESSSEIKKMYEAGALMRSSDHVETKLDAAEIERAVLFYCENPYWREMFEGSPSIECARRIALTFYRSLAVEESLNVNDIDFLLETRRLEDSFDADDWRHLLKYSGNNPRRSLYRRKLAGLESMGDCESD